MYLLCVTKLISIFMLANGSPSFSGEFCDDVIMMATLFLLQLLSTVYQTDVRARGVCEEN